MSANINSLKLNSFYINGEWCAPQGVGQFTIINPATERSLGELAMGNSEDVDRAAGRYREQSTAGIRFHHRGRRFRRLHFGQPAQ